MKNEKLVKVRFNVDRATGEVYALMINDSTAQHSVVFTKGLGIQVKPSLAPLTDEDEATPKQYAKLKKHMQERGYSLEVINKPPHEVNFESWHETHFEIVQALIMALNKRVETNMVKERHKEQGTGGMYELAQELTDKFESENMNREWDGEFFDEIDEFLQKELK